MKNNQIQPNPGGPSVLDEPDDIVKCDICRNDKSEKEVFICKDCEEGALSWGITACERNYLLSGMKRIKNLCKELEFALTIGNSPIGSPEFIAGQIKGIMQACLKYCER